MIWVSGTATPKTGAVPFTLRLRSTGGTRCLNDLFVRAKTAGGGINKCYMLTVTGTKGPHDVPLTGQGEAQLNLSAGSYASGAQLTLTLRRTGPPTHERITADIELHL